ncbi:MAG: N-acetyltransferase [Spirochaetaceae bacterium]|nr:MAG: N-acetyltransferase [Spirochaetaceae bacterium]
MKSCTARVLRTGPKRRGKRETSSDGGWSEKRQGLRVQLARDNDGAIVGMIQYTPIEHAPLYGRDLYYIYCVWVHGHKQGVGSRLLDAAESDARTLGAKGIVAWGLRIPVFMRSRWFRKRRYRSIGSGVHR